MFVCCQYHKYKDAKEGPVVLEERATDRSQTRRHTREAGEGVGDEDGVEKRDVQTRSTKELMKIVCRSTYVYTDVIF